MFNSLNYLNPVSSLDRGYGIILDDKNNMITSVDNIIINEELKLLIKDGIINVKVVKISKGEFYNENENLTYEEAIKELEQIIVELEGENLTLKHSLEKFKRGVFLYNYCNEILKDVEGEIKILLKDENGNLEEEDFYMEV